MSRIDFALSAQQRIDARAAIRLLEGTGIGIEEAARRALAGRRGVKRIKIEEAIDQFVRSRMTNGKRAATVDWYTAKLKLFGGRFGGHFWDDVDRPALSAWLDAVPLGISTRAGMARAIRALWRWGMKHEPPLVGTDATAGLRTSARRAARSAGVNFFSVFAVSRSRRISAPT